MKKNNTTLYSRNIFKIIIVFVIIFFTLFLIYQNTINRQSIHFISEIKRDFGDCKRIPKFISNLKLNGPIISTSNGRNLGLLLYSVSDVKNGDNNIPENFIQLETWTKFGRLGHFVRDIQGRIYTYPAPMINLEDNPPSLQNKILYVDENTGILSEYLELPKSSSANKLENPFGVIGIAYDCDTRILYVSSIYDSTRKNQLGNIYAIDTSTKKIIDKYSNIDVGGLLIVDAGSKHILMGNLREGDMHAIELDNYGKFKNNLQNVFKLDKNVFNAGTPVIKKITYENNKLILKLTQFEFNLIPASEQPEITVELVFNKSSKKYIATSIK